MVCGLVGVSLEPFSLSLAFPPPLYVFRPTRPTFVLVLGGQGESSALAFGLSSGRGVGLVHRCRPGSDALGLCMQLRARAGVLWRTLPSGGVCPTLTAFGL